MKENINKFLKTKHLLNLAIIFVILLFLLGLSKDFLFKM